MGTNSSNKKLTSQSSNAIITMNGQLGDEQSSVPVTANVDVAIANNGVTTYEYKVNDSKRTVEFTWPDNRNTQGSISGSLNFNVQNDIPNSGGNTIVNVSGLNYVGSSNEKTEQEARPTITIKIPKNPSTFDTGGTYVFDTYMENWEGFIRGIYQCAYNESNPTGLLKLTPEDNWITIKNTNQMTTDSFEYIDGEFTDTPLIVGSSNLPSVKFGDASGNQNLNVIRYDNIDKYSFTSTNNNGTAFITTKADVSNATVDERTGTVKYTFTKFNSSNNKVLTGKFNVKQEKGTIDVSDPKITYNWSLIDNNKIIKEYNIDGNHCDVILNDNKGANSAMYGTITCDSIRQDWNSPEYSQLYGVSQLSGDMSYVLAKNTQTRQAQVNCNITVDAVNNDTITNKNATYTIVQKGSSYTYIPEYKLKVSIVDEHNNSQYVIPGTNNTHPSLLVSSSGLDGTFRDSTYITIKGTDKTGGSSKISDWPKLYYKFGDNRPTGLIDGSVTGTVNVTTLPSNLNFTYKGGMFNLILRGGSNLTFVPAKTKRVERMKWKVTSELFNTSNSNPLSFASTNKISDFEAIQEAIPENNQNYVTLHINVKTPNKTSTVNLTYDNKNKIIPLSIQSNELKYDYYKVVNKNKSVIDFNDKYLHRYIASGGLDYDDENTTVSKERNETMTLSTDINSVTLSKDTIPIKIGAENINGAIEFTNSTENEEHAKLIYTYYINNLNISFERPFDVSMPQIIPLSNPKKTFMDISGIEYEKSFEYMVLNNPNPAVYDTSKIAFTTTVDNGDLLLGSEVIYPNGGKVKLKLIHGTESSKGDDITDLQISYRLVSTDEYGDPKYYANANKTESPEGTINIPTIEGIKPETTSAYKGVYYISGVDYPTVGEPDFKEIGDFDANNDCTLNIGKNLPTQPKLKIAYNTSNNTNSLCNYPFKLTCIAGKNSNKRNFTLKVFDANAEEYSRASKTIVQNGLSAATQITCKFNVEKQSNCKVTCDDLILRSGMSADAPTSINIRFEDHPVFSNTTPLPNMPNTSYIGTDNTYTGYAYDMNDTGIISISDFILYNNNDIPKYKLSFNLNGDYIKDTNGILTRYLLGNYSYSATVTCTDYRNLKYVSNMIGTKNEGLYGPIALSYSMRSYWKCTNGTYYDLNNNVLQDVPNYKKENIVKSKTQKYEYLYQFKDYKNVANVTVNDLPKEMLAQYPDNINVGTKLYFEYKVKCLYNGNMVENGRIRETPLKFYLRIKPAKYRYSCYIEANSFVPVNKKYNSLDNMPPLNAWILNINPTIHFHTDRSIDEGRDWSSYSDVTMTYTYFNNLPADNFHKKVFNIDLWHESDGNKTTYGIRFSPGMKSGNNGELGFGSSDHKTIKTTLRIQLKDSYKKCSYQGIVNLYPYSSNITNSIESKWWWYGESYYNQ